MKKYLSSEVRNRIKQESPELLPDFRSILKEWINHRYAWMAIVMFTITVFFCGHYINFESLNIIRIENDNIKPMVESRTTNMVAMISISFAVIGFLISNLAIKGNKSYNILFRRTFFLPIIYFSLTLMGSFIILTALKDHLDIQILGRILYVGIFLMLVDIVLIGILFSKLIVFTNSKQLYKMICADLSNESKSRIYQWVKKEKSKQIINNIVYNKNPYLFSVEYHSQLIDIKKKPYLKDINIKNLQAIITRNKEKQIYQNELFLGKDLTNDKELFYTLPDNKESSPSLKLFGELNSTAIFTRYIKETSSETREYIKNEISKLIEADDYRSVEQLLAEYAKVAQMKYFENVLLEEFLSDIKELIHKAIKYDALESFNRLDGFIVNVLISAITEKSLINFNRFLGLVKVYYTATKDPGIGNKTSKWSRELSARRIREIIWAIDSLIEKQNDINAIQSFTAFTYYGYLHFADLLKMNIDFKDLACFEFSCNQLDNIKLGSRYDNFGDIGYELRYFEDKQNKRIFIEKRMSDFYHFCCLIGIKYWLYWLYNNDQISATSLKDYLNYIKIEPNRQIPRFWEMELLFSKLNSPLVMTFFNWGMWTYYDESPKEGEVHTITSSIDWIFLGYAVDIILADTLSPFDGDVDLSQWEVKVGSNKEHFLNLLLQKLSLVDTNIEKWRTYFEKDSFAIDHIKKQLEEMQENNKRQIIQADIAPTKVIKFKTEMQKAWNPAGIDESRFGDFAIIDFTEYTTTTEEKLAERTKWTIEIDNGKRMFVDGASENFTTLSSFVSDFKKRFNNDILRSIIQSQKVVSIEKDWDFISTILESNLGDGSIVITSFNLAREIYERYPGAKIRITNNRSFNNTLIIVDMTSAFNIQVSKDTEGNILNIGVNTVSHEQAEAISDHYCTDKGQKEIITNNLMNQIIIDIEISWNIKVNKMSACTILYLKQ